MRLFPILRADFKVVEEYIYQKKNKLNIPIDVLYGNEEIDVETDIFKWKEESLKQVNIFEFKGDHFFIYEHTKNIANHLIRGFRKYTD